MKKSYLSLLLFFSCIGYGTFGQTSITINTSTTYQTIRGFGGQGLMTSGYDVYLRNLVDLMGLSGYRYYMDGSASGAITPAQINAGTYNFTDNNNNANFFKALKAKGVTFIIATCWSPPASLKKNNCLCQAWKGLIANCCLGTSACGAYNCFDTTNYILDEYYDEYGKYLAAWTQDFQTKTTQTLYAMNIQNEPLFNEPYASAYLSAPRFGHCLQAVKTEFTNAGLTNVKFHGPEHIGNFASNAGATGEDSRYTKYLLWDTASRKALDIYSVHGYMDGIVPDLGNAPSWTSFDTAVRKWNKELWMSETEFGGDDWTSAFDMAKQLYLSLKYGKVNAWLHWSMSPNFTMSNLPTVRLYICMHYMRFIRPGYQQVECTESDPDIAAMAFKNNSDYTIVALNLNSSQSKTVTFNDFTGKPSYFDMYRSMARNTTDIERCAYAGRVTDNSFILPPKSIITLYYKGSEPDVYYSVDPPTNLQATNIGDNSFKVNWTAASGWTLNGTPATPINVTGYSVYLNGIKKTISGPVTGTSYSFNGLTKNTNYVVEIYTRDAINGESVAATITVTTTCSTNDCGPPPALENNNDESLHITPNPSAGPVRIELPDDKMYILSVISLSGNTVLEQNVRNNDRIDTGNLPKGIYIVVAKADGRVLKTKLAIE